MDPFSRAGDFYSEAFEAQSAAASAQKTNQRRGLTGTMYDQELSDTPYGTPLIPKSGKFGVYKEESEGTSDFIENMKNDMLIKAAALRREKEDLQKIRAGNGTPTQSLS